ncbi:hypothetical protein H072_1065 [Dactylellina haptotyla CBS 200.50]|uniref:Golgi to ER traffic protein 2 n=1 Tax=Dactylellina haptotyla (strain CBS 200.50) TaxID=1284197 RepID=S8BZT8_DACHA|nr:hypothetical protein H072_1065 [Dactylellina haptotyla CBS 200.50]
MADLTPQAPEQTTPSDESLAQMTPLSVSEQARIRREMRKQKMGKGADRLRKITQTQRTAAGFGDGYKKDEPQLQDSPTPAPRPATFSDLSDTDPEVSDHFYQPVSNRIRDAPNSIPPPTPPSQSEFALRDDQIAQMMMQGNPLFGTPGGGATPGDMANDPLLQMMQQMLGGMPGGPLGGPPGGPDGSGGGIPPELLSSMLGGGFGPGGPTAGDQPQQQQPEEAPFAKWWKLLHVLCSMLLGVYAVLNLPGRYTGSKADRLRFEDAPKIPLLWYFATMELVLQSTRYLLVEKGGPPPGLILATISRFLPRPLGTAIITLSHYFKIFSTIWQDGLVLIFTIGMTGWVNSWFADEEDMIVL